MNQKTIASIGIILGLVLISSFVFLVVSQNTPMQGRVEPAVSGPRRDIQMEQNTCAQNAPVQNPPVQEASRGGKMHLTFLPIESYPVEATMQQAFIVIIGDVVSLNPVEIRPNVVYTDASIRVQNVLKGQVTDSCIVVRFQGGRLADVQTVVDPPMELKVGETVLLPLRNDTPEYMENKYYIIYHHLGKFLLQNSRVMNEPRGIDMPLEEFLRLYLGAP